MEDRWTLTSLVRKHKRAAAASLLLVLAAVAVTVLTTVSDPHPQPLGDYASCSQWAAATHAEQTAYSNLYIDEYGRVADTARHAGEVRGDIDRACTHASYLGEADDVSIIASIHHAF